MKTITDNLNAINEKAKLKKDGVYSHSGISYRVKNNTVTHIAYNGKILECHGIFNIQIGSYDGYHLTASKIMKTI